jgi:hypothetical protein
MTTEQRAIDIAERIAQEKAAHERTVAAIKAIGDDMQVHWHWGDGEGGHVLDLLRQEVLSRGFRWPYDARTPSVPKKEKIPRSLAKAVFERDAYWCVTCSSHIDLSCDHIIAESKGGPTTFENLQTMCRPCNSRKGNR